MFFRLQLMIVLMVSLGPLVAVSGASGASGASDAGAAKAGRAVKAGKAYTRPHLPGPFAFEVLDVLDGDTFRARIPVWLDQHVVVKIRLRDIDTPEMNGKCAAEKTLAVEARAFAANWLAQDGLQLVNISYGTYAGRVLATTQTLQGATLSDALLAAGLAKPYHGRKANWCA